MKVAGSETSSLGLISRHVYILLPRGAGGDPGELQGVEGREAGLKEGSFERPGAGKGGILKCHGRWAAKPGAGSVTSG